MLRPPRAVFRKNIFRQAAVHNFQSRFLQKTLKGLFFRLDMAFKKITLQHFIGMLIAFFLAITWLLPNHTLPWTTFHSDAWMAIVFIGIGFVACIFPKGKSYGYTINFVTLLIIPIPFIQQYIGLLPFLGQAVIGAAYVAGFLFAQIAGQRLQTWRAVWVGNIFFGAILSAAVVSVGMQLFQWFGLSSSSELTAIWIVAVDVSRPSANLAQPNLLATLILWAILAVLWFSITEHINDKSRLFIIIFLLIGLALTQSRSGFLGIILLSVICLFSRKKDKQLPRKFTVLALLFFYILVISLLEPLSQLLLLDNIGSIYKRPSGQARWLAWRMFWDAIVEKPWFGYGWNNVMQAHLQQAEQHPEVGQLFAQTHNLFLDFFVWVGIPIGLFLSIFIIHWMVTAFTKVKNKHQAIYFIMVCLVGLHSMVEFPLHHAYFLLPIGFLIGTLNESLNSRPIVNINAAGRTFFSVGFGVLTILLLISIRDYFFIENASTNLRFNSARIGKKQKIDVGSLLLFDQFKTQLNFFMLELNDKVPKDELVVARNLATVLPSYYNMLKLITLLALNHQPDEARQWMRRCPHVLDELSKQQLVGDWIRVQANYSALKNFNWEDQESFTSNTVTRLSPP